MSSNKVNLTTPVVPSSPRGGSPADPKPATAVDSSTAAGDSVDDSSGASEGKVSVEGGLLPSARRDDEAEEVSSEGRTTWNGETLRPLRTPLFVIEIAAVGEKSKETFAYSQRLGAVKESALALIDKAVVSTQVMMLRGLG